MENMERKMIKRMERIRGSQRRNESDFLDIN